MSRKNPQNIVPINPSKYQSGQEQDTASFMSLLLCSGGMFLRNRFLIWFSIFFMISTLCRRKYSASLTQYLANAGMIIFALISTYMFQPYTNEQVKLTPPV